MGKDRLPEIASAAVECELLAALPTGLGDVIAGQCILESGWLDHAPGNNCFGIKATPTSHPDLRQLLPTTEYFTDDQLFMFLYRREGRTATLSFPLKIDKAGRKRYNVTDLFAVFPTLSACFAERARLFRVGRYAISLADFRLNHDLPAFVRSIGPVYATDPNYSDNLLAVIRQPDVMKAIHDARNEAAVGAGRVLST